MGTPSGQWLDDPRGTRWWFDAGCLALDFAWTGAPDSRHRETFTRPTDLAEWLAERFPLLDPALGDRELNDALLLRSAIQGLAGSVVARTSRSTSDIDIVNLVAATPNVAPVLPGGSRQAGAGRVSFRQALSAIARDAVRILGSELEGRLRECGAPDCTYTYLDTSRSGNRQWCSMQRCGNRAKVRAHRERAAMERYSTTLTSFQNAT